MTMNLKMGSQTFIDVQIPLLWGSRAVLQDQLGRLSVINLSGGASRLEIVGDKPAPGIEFLPSIDGYEILSKGKPIYRYDPEEKTLSSIDLGLPDCQVGRWQIRVGSNVFSGNTVIGSGVGIAVTEDGIAMGAPLPPGLAKLVV
jgi:hypothetical protein